MEVRVLPAFALVMVGRGYLFLIQDTTQTLNCSKGTSGSGGKCREGNEANKAQRKG